LPPQSASGTRASQIHASLRAVVLSCGWYASRRRPSRSSAVLVERSRLVVQPPRGLRTRAPILLRIYGDLPQACTPLQSVTRALFYVLRRTRFPEVLRPHSATLPLRSTTPRLACLGHVAPSPLYWDLGALLPQRSPWYPFNQARSRGSHPSELDLAEIATTSRCNIPSCD
jgi:hypothetical protein